jgi:hypothetical protein
MDRSCASQGESGIESGGAAYGKIEERTSRGYRTTFPGKRMKRIGKAVLPDRIAVLEPETVKNPFA